MAQEPLDGMSGSNPPSFIPSGAPRRRPSAPKPAAGAQPIPQTFEPKGAPARRSSARTPQESFGTQPPSFSPASAGQSAARTTAGRHHTTIGEPRSESLRTASVPSSGMGGHRPASFSQHAFGASGPSPRPSRSGRRGAIAVSPKRIRHRLLAVLAAIVAVLILLTFSLVSWVNGQLTHKNMLTSMADTPASTWLILGSDQRDGTAGTGSSKDIPGSRTDSILVLTKPKTGHSSLISIPRDSFVNINGQDMKINAVASQIGYKALTSQVESITGMKIDHVVQVGFGGVEKVVDAIDGVELCYDRTVNDVLSGLNWKAGCHQADGATALAFSRMRYSDPTGDIGRAKRQRQVLAAVAKKATSPQVLLNPAKTKKLAEAGLSTLTVDEKTGAFDIAQMALAFKAASGSSGVTGTLYYTDIDYRPASGIGSCILLDGTRNTTLFQQLQSGTHDPGTVGGL
ncbi:LCP family protein [Bifidobacterium simiarum]|uniref:Transcriptional regulator n=1 Tax=Bifidobacterium simiarum TaxID=2045441 RepID=A0A2M9HDW4_9BIFI|nr:LCP family protein [Bifidobacterium simiarum]PJM75001.1 transcriptional regulator [Bifidobacterium simiarum]